MQCKSSRTIHMVCRLNYLLYHFSITSRLHLTSFYAKIYLKKKDGEMLIEQIIEVELRGPGPPNHTCSPKLVVFMTKQ